MGSNINDQLPQLITLAEACDLLKCHPNTLRSWDKQGILKSVRFGTRRIRKYRKEDRAKLLHEADRSGHHIVPVGVAHSQLMEQYDATFIQRRAA